jgi:integrase
MCWKGQGIYPHILVLLYTGMRRGALMGLQWGHVDLEKGKIRIERAIEVAKARGNRIKAPKTRRGRRVISLPPVAVEVMREQRKVQLELRRKLGGAPAVVSLLSRSRCRFLLASESLPWRITVSESSAINTTFETTKEIKRDA